MKREEVKELVENGVCELHEALAAGKSDRLQQYLDVMGRFPRYSFNNCILIAVQAPEATMCQGFHAWKKLGRTVKKGEKGIGIIAPMIGRKKDDDGSVNEDGEKSVFGFKVVHVFDVSQTEGDELPQVAEVTGDTGNNIEAAESLIRSWGIELLYEDIPGGADGVSKKGTIVIAPNLPPAKRLLTLVHEGAHEKLHARRGASKGNNKDDSRNGGRSCCSCRLSSTWARYGRSLCGLYPALRRGCGGTCKVDGLHPEDGGEHSRRHPRPFSHRCKRGDGMSGTDSTRLPLMRPRRLRLRCNSAEGLDRQHDGGSQLRRRRSRSSFRRQESLTVRLADTSRYLSLSADQRRTRMDPDECFAMILENIAHSEWNDAAENAANLREWMMEGGFSPGGGKHPKDVNLRFTALAHHAPFTQ